ncbi:DUF6113 family protein [Streptomyces sp. NPDC059740]|uniref:DUF6113 family protein n=1 Tax=Streptomyces sp. NPDC059740 TaxID=3346926 RepID=UPI003666421E
MSAAKGPREPRRSEDGTGTAREAGRRQRAGTGRAGAKPAPQAGARSAAPHGDARGASKAAGRADGTRARPGYLNALLGVALLLLGVLVAGAGALLQAAWFPGGLVLALAATAGVLHGGARLVRSTWGALVPAAGWLVAVISLAGARPEGDFLFAAGAGSYLFLLGGIAVAVICATTAHMASAGPRASRLGG